MSEMQNLVEATDLRVQRGGFRLTIDSWQVPPGCCVGIVGPNAAGKTTLLRLLPGLDGCEPGRLNVVGADPMKDVVAVRTQVGFMSDDLPVPPLRVDHYLRLLSGYYETWDAQLVEELMKRFEVPWTESAQLLSRGQGARLRLVSAMAYRPRLLILDEPAAGLDLGSRMRLLETVLDVAADPERSVLISSHQLNDVERIADRLLVLDEGKVVREGQTDQLLEEGKSLEEAMLDWGAAG